MDTIKIEYQVLKDIYTKMELLRIKLDDIFIVEDLIEVSTGDSSDSIRSVLSHLVTVKNAIGIIVEGVLKLLQLIASKFSEYEEDFVSFVANKGEGQ